MKRFGFLFDSGAEGAWRDLGLLLIRLGCGGSMAWLHGWSKVERLIDGAHRFPDPWGIGPLPSLVLAAFAEFACALAVALGFMGRWASLPLVITMGTAAFVHHAGDPWGERELAVVYLIVFAGLLFTGPGKISVDRWIGRK